MGAISNFTSENTIFVIWNSYKIALRSNNDKVLILSFANGVIKDYEIYVNMSPKQYPFHFQHNFKKG